MTKTIDRTKKAPYPPHLGDPCNGCGICCAIALCHIAEPIGLSGPPCEALEWDKETGRFWCKVISSLDADSALRDLGVGLGCDSDVRDALQGWVGQPPDSAGGRIRYPRRFR